jgi:hypothetical protein
VSVRQVTNRPIRMIGTLPQHPLVKLARGLVSAPGQPTTG